MKTLRVFETFTPVTGLYQPGIIAPAWTVLKRRLFLNAWEDYVAAENPVRFLDAFVALLDLHGLGFAKARGAATRPAAI